jgi:amino acid transporter
MGLKRTIKTPALMCTAIGGMLGSGWLFGPFLSAQIAGPASIISWAIGGILMMFIAFCFAELSSTFPIAGGMARFAQLSHGTLVGFTIAWVSYLAAVIVSPMEAMAAVQYAANYFPEIANHTNHGIELTKIGIIISISLMFIFCYFNTLGAKFVAKSNMILVIFKFIVPVATIIILFSSSHHIGNFTHFGGFAPYGLKGILTALPAAGIIFSFIGYGPAVQLAQEAKNPKKAIPTAIIGALIISIVLYIIIEIAFIGAVNPHDLAHGWKHLSFKGDYGPIAGIIGGLGLMWFVKIIYFDAFVSPCGTGYIYTAATSRINYAMAKNGYFPEQLLKLNKKGVPYLAIIMNFCIGMIFFLPFPGWQQMINFLVSCFVIAYTIAPITTLSLRKHKPEIKRPFKVPSATIFCTVSFIICNFILYWSGWDVIWKMLLTIAIGYAFLAIYRACSKKEHQPLGFKSFWWMIPYFIGLGVISYCGSFGGGHNYIPFGWDAAIIAGFSVIILYLSQKCSYITESFDEIYQEAISTQKNNKNDNKDNNK